MKDGRILFINEEECKKVLPLSRVLELMEVVLAEHAEGTATLPIKLHMGLRPEINGYINCMPSNLKKHNVYGVKLAGCHYDNPKKGLPTAIGTINLYHPENGLPFSIMDGTYITAVRTGAIAGVASKYMSRADSRVLVIVGAGVQGNTAFRSIMACNPTVEEVRLVEPYPETVKRFIENNEKEYPIKYVHSASVQEACRGAQIVHAAHSAPKPLLQGIEYDPGTHVIITAEPFITKEWLMSTFDRRITDFPECLVTRLNQEASYYSERDGIPFVELTPDFSEVTLGEVVAGQRKGRENDDEIIITLTVGMSVEDVICGLEVYEQAVEQGLGVELRLLDM